jgi:hypothetical protein
MCSGKLTKGRSAHPITISAKHLIRVSGLFPVIQCICQMPVSLQHVFTQADRGTICSSNCSECKAFDQGLLTVSSHSVQLTDASEFAT